MGIRGKFIIVITVIGLFMIGVSWTIVSRSQNELIETDALRIAEIVSTQVVADRSIYTGKVVGKLTGEGFGAAEKSEEQKGFIMLPAQFVRAVSKVVAEKAGDLYQYTLKSKWNLNKEQGLSDDFDKWGWSELEVQDKAFASTPTEKGYPWKPAYRFTTDAKGNRMLSYMRADPAAAAACVTCHNNYEKRPDILEYRKLTGVEQSKEWKLHSLMGAIRVDIPLSEVAKTAESGRKILTSGMLGTFGVGFLALLGLIFVSIIKPVEKSVSQVEEFTKKVDDVISCNRKLMNASEKQTQAIKKGDNAIDLNEVKNIANQNAMDVEESAVYCRELDSSFKSLKATLLKILGKGE